ncbi:MAG: DUF1015 domain-containing protein [Planctomycetes bacterium]|nr:DUF1015 domain-containing protein [Planctomycetota bacterium]
MIRPFRALRPTPEKAALVASVPYDVCSTAEARVLAKGNPDSFLHVVRPEIDLPEGTDVHDDAVYAKARENFEAFQARGTLVREETPCVYLYRQIMAGHAQTGIVATFSVDEYDHDKILKHEKTRPDKEADRTRHVTTLGAQAGPVFLTFPPNPRVRELMREVCEGEPLFDFNAVDGVQHTVWRVEDPQPLVDAFGEIPLLYVADGHHRSASASNVRRQRREDGKLTPDDPANFFLAVAFPSDAVQILPYNRLITDLGGRTPEAFLRELRGVLPCEKVDSAEAARGEVRMYLAGSWYRIPLEPNADDPVSRLDVQVLAERILSPMLGIENQRTDERISFVGGIRGTKALSDAVDAGEAMLAFSLPAVTPAELLAVADASRTMPPKSTWFEPKLRSGLLVYTL